jgi:PAS domain S-box-containing protein
LSLDSTTNDWAKAFSTGKKHFNMFYERMMDGFAYHKILVDQNGKPIDYIFLEVNNAFERMTGLKREKVLGKKVTEVLKWNRKRPCRLDWTLWKSCAYL